MAINTADEWGTVSHRFTDLVALLKVKIALQTNRLNEASIPSTGDAEPGLVATIEAAHAIALASKDLRSALSAYAHRMRLPRPKVGAIADAQETNAQGLARRYSAATLNALEHLIAGDAEVEVLMAAFPSLTNPEAERLVSGPRGSASATRRSHDTGAAQPSASVSAEASSAS